MDINEEAEALEEIQNRVLELILNSKLCLDVIIEDIKVYVEENIE